MINRKASLSLLLSLIILALSACSDRSINTPEETPASDGQTYTLRITAGPSPETRSIIKDRNSKGIILKWNEGMFDLNIAFVQEGKVRLQRGVEVLETKGEYCTFEVTLPKGIDADKKFDLYGIVAQDILLKNGRLMVGVGARPLYELTKYSNNQDGYVPVYFCTKEVSVFDKEIKADFVHLGSLAVVTLKNSSDKPWRLAGMAVRPADGVTEFYHKGSLPFVGNARIPYLNIMDLTEAPVDYMTAVTYPDVTIAPGETQHLGFWFRANTESTPEVSLVAYNPDGPKEIISTNTLPARTAMQPGRAYNLYAEWSGTELKLVAPFDKEPPSDLPTIKFTLNDVPTEGILLSISPSNQEAESTAWIDLNANGTFDRGEAITEFQYDLRKDNMTLYKPTETTLTIHGDISGFAVSGVSNKDKEMINWLTSLEVSDNSPLSTLVVYNGQIKSGDLSGLKRLKELEWVANGTETLTLPINGQTLQSVIVSGNPGLKTIDISTAPNTIMLFLEENGLTSITCPASFKDLWIGSLKGNKLDKLALQSFMLHLNKAGQKYYNWMYSLDISENPGSADADTSEAAAKGWVIKRVK